MYVLQAHFDALAGHYGKAKRESKMAWTIVIVAVLIDVLIVIGVVVVVVKPKLRL